MPDAPLLELESPTSGVGDIKMQGKLPLDQKTQLTGRGTEPAWAPTFVGQEDMAKQPFTPFCNFNPFCKITVPGCKHARPPHLHQPSEHMYPYRSGLWSFTPLLGSSIFTYVPHRGRRNRYEYHRIHYLYGHCPLLLQRLLAVL